jgi:hypothetical protein
MRVFHRTSRETAADIRIMGFHYPSDAAGAGAEGTGVWMSDQPIDASDDAGAALVTPRSPIALFERHEHSGVTSAVFYPSQSTPRYTW